MLLSLNYRSFGRSAPFMTLTFRTYKVDRRMLLNSQLYVLFACDSIRGNISGCTIRMSVREFHQRHYYRSPDNLEPAERRIELPRDRTLAPIQLPGLPFLLRLDHLIVSSEPAPGPGSAVTQRSDKLNGELLFEGSQSKAQPNRRRAGTFAAAMEIFGQFDAAIREGHL